MDITNSSALLLGTSVMGTGSLTLTANGVSQDGVTTLTQADNAGAVSITGGAGAISIANSNKFTGVVALSTSSNASLVADIVPLTMAASNISGTLSLVSGGSLSETGIITAGGALTLTLANTGNIDLSTAANNFGSTVTLGGTLAHLRIWLCANVNAAAALHESHQSQPDQPDAAV